MPASTPARDAAATVPSPPVLNRLREWSRALVARRDRVTRHEVAISAVLILAFAFYLWTADTSVPFDWNTHDADIYNLLTTAFLHGHTYLPLHVPAGLLHLKNPFDPVQNAAYRAGGLHDLLLHDGRLYSVWGPTPVFALFMPFRLTGLQMSPSFAVALFSFVGLVCAVKLMHVLVRRFVPATPAWLLLVGTVGLALTNAVPFMLRRPAQYEVAISCGYAFEMMGLLLVVTAVLAKPARIARLGLGSLCLGLAMGARLSLLAGGAVPLAAAIYLMRKRDAGRRILLVTLGPVALCVLLLGIYNAVRFGSFSDFGANYQLAGVDPSTLAYDQLSYLPPAFFSYLLMPPTFSLTFPHILLNTTALYPFPFPHLYQGSHGSYAEPAGGLLPTTPLTLLLLWIPFRWRRRPGERPTLAVAGGLSLLALAIIALLALALPGTTERYEVDYVTYFLIAATIVWALIVTGRPARTTGRRVAATLGVLCTVYASLVGVAISFSGYSPLLRANAPGVWNTLQDLTSPIDTLAVKLAGKAVISDVYAPLGVAFQPQNLATVDAGGASAWLGGGPIEVDVAAPSSGRLLLHAEPQLGPGIAPGTRLTVRAVSAHGTTSDTPVTGPSVSLPIEVDTGLNRITIGLVGAVPRSASVDKLYLGTLTVSR